MAGDVKVRGIRDGALPQAYFPFTASLDERRAERCLS